ncbi:MAG: hypothetical protein ACREMX_16195 [Gemmatimonadales bacterium]
MAARHVFGPATARVAADIHRITGVKTSGALHELLATDVRHMLRRHGPEGEAVAGQVPITEADLRLIPTILRDYDDLPLARRSPEGWPAVQYQTGKRAALLSRGGLGTVEALWGVARLRGRTMWKASIRADDAFAPPSTAETDSRFDASHTAQRTAPPSAGQATG